MDSNWNTTGFGTEQASATISGGRIWLRVNADIRPGAGRRGRFSYSTDGTNFTPLGPGFVMGNDWRFFMGYRYAIFNHATQALGGAVTVAQFTLAGPNPTPPSRVVSLRAHANGSAGVVATVEQRHHLRGTAGPQQCLPRGGGLRRCAAQRVQWRHPAHRILCGAGHPGWSTQYLASAASR